ncbi:hypothetical protein AcW1_009576 [Taiwanofungus camphoratus]|nr:hypothetical protein AcV5_002522 [Antrodia cinnamomea]KAI0942109.1 hypothetical protein AcV7_002631 [Antrodia cinnamomea]KAI0947944.1 hypothetical protein AcW1_009576 [Antrodia cinnamomea]
MTTPEPQPQVLHENQVLHESEQPNTPKEPADDGHAGVSPTPETQPDSSPALEPHRSPSSVPESLSSSETPSEDLAWAGFRPRGKVTHSSASSKPPNKPR